MGRQDVGFLHVRTGEDDRRHRRGLHRGARPAARSSRSPTFGGIYTRRDPHGGAVDTATPSAPTSGWRRRRSVGSQNLRQRRTTCTRPARSAPGGDSFGVTAAMPNDLWNIQMSTRQVDEALQPGRRFRHPPRLPALSARSSTTGRARATAAIVRRYAFSTAVDVQTDMHERPADPRGRPQGVRHQLPLAGFLLGDGRRTLTSGWTSRSRSARASRCR